MSSRPEPIRFKSSGSSFSTGWKSTANEEFGRAERGCVPAPPPVRGWKISFEFNRAKMEIRTRDDDDERAQDCHDYIADRGGLSFEFHLGMRMSRRPELRSGRLSKISHVLAAQPL